MSQPPTHDILYDIIPTTGTSQEQVPVNSRQRPLWQVA